MLNPLKLFAAIKKHFSLDSLWVNQPPLGVKKVGISSEPATVGTDSTRDMFKEILDKPNINHEDMRKLSRVFFNTDVTSNLYCFRHGNPYGLVLGICNIGVNTNEGGELTDIFLHMSDTSMDTSLSVTVSVKDLNELFRPFFLHQRVRA